MTAAILIGATLVAGCGSDAPSPPANEDVAALARLQFSCGHDLFPLMALSGPVGAERAATAQAEALRRFLTGPAVPGRPNLPIGGYRLLAEGASSAEYAAVSNEFDTGLAYVRLEHGPAGWIAGQWGACRPQVAFEGLNSATWEFAPDVPFPNRASTHFTALVSETTCTGGVRAEGRVLPPAILTSPTEVLVIFAVRPLPPRNGLVTCPGPPPTRVEVSLTEPLGERRLLDGGVSPPNDPHPEVIPVDIDPIH